MNEVKCENMFAMIWGLRHTLSAVALIVIGTTLYTILMSAHLSTILSEVDGVPRSRNGDITTSRSSKFNEWGNGGGSTFNFSSIKSEGIAQAEANRCHISDLTKSLEIPANFSSIVAAYRKQIPDLIARARQNQRKGRPRLHERFKPFSPLFKCTDVTSIGGGPQDDTSKLVCGMTNLKEGCIVYSIGGNNQWEFELDIVKQTPCSVYTFDCTGPRNRFQVPKHDRIVFEHICLGSQPESGQSDCSTITKCGPTMTLQKIQERLNHSRAADLLKMDIEGYEIPLFLSWKEGSNYPQQILLELHYMTQFEDLADDYHKNKGRVTRSDWEFAFEEDIINLASHLMDLGFFTAIRNDNLHCNHCTELSLVQMKTHCEGGLK